MKYSSVEDMMKGILMCKDKRRRWRRRRSKHYVRILDAMKKDDGESRRGKK